MVRPCQIISKSLRAVSSQEYRSCIMDFVQVIEGIIYTDFQMFRSDSVAYFNG